MGSRKDCIFQVLIEDVSHYMHMQKNFAYVHMDETLPMFPAATAHNQQQLGGYADLLPGFRTTSKQNHRQRKLHPAGECELEDEFHVSGDSSAQLLAAANAANNAQAIITTLLEEYENIFDMFHFDSRVENCGTEDSADDDNIDVKVNGYHDAENEVDQETDDDDADHVHSGKLSESSGYAGSDLSDYKAFGGDDSDVGSSNSNHVKAENSNLNVVPDIQLSEDQNKQRNGNGNSVNIVAAQFHCHCSFLDRN